MSNKDLKKQLSEKTEAIREKAKEGNKILDDKVGVYKPLIYIAIILVVAYVLSIKYPLISTVLIIVLAMGQLGKETTGDIKGTISELMSKKDKKDK